jgi:DNA-binding PadR family transcriptional regulator
VARQRSTTGTLDEAATDTPTPELALLGFLALEPAHGYELHRRLTHELGELWHASLAHVYNVLKRMEAQGLIRGRAMREGNYPPQRQFELSPAGHAALEAWIRKPVSSSARSIRLEFLARLYFAQQLNPRRAKALLDEQRRSVAETVAQLQHIAADAVDAPDFARLAAELRLAQARTIQDWLDSSLVPLIGPGGRKARQGK